jgi:FkbM family methyltransferase
MNKYKIIKYLGWLQQFGVCGLKRIMHGGDAGRGLIELKSNRYGKIWCRNCLEDLEVINTVLIFNAYHIQEKYRACKTILDLGANIGIATRFFCKHLPEARIVALEPSEKNCQIFKINMEKEISAGRVKLVRCAIGAEDGAGHFKVGDNIRFDSFKVVKNDAETEAASGIYEQVPIMGIDGLMKRLEGPLIVKIDIEGAEQDLLNCRSKWINAADCLMVEFHVRSQERDWLETLAKEGWVAAKYFDTWHFTKANHG